MDYVSSMQTHFIASRTPWLQCFGVMSSAVDAAILVEINQIDQKLEADTTNETFRVPENVWTGPRCHHYQVTAAHCFLALRKNKTNCMQENVTKKFRNKSNLSNQCLLEVERNNHINVIFAICGLTKRVTVFKIQS